MSTAVPPRLAAASVQGRRLHVRFDDGSQATHSLLWLRDACACAACRHPHTGQRTIEVLDLPAQPHVDRAHVVDGGDGLAVTWAEGGHDSRYGAALLQADPPERDPPVRVPWRGGAPTAAVPWAAPDPGWRRAVLGPLLRDGYVRMSGAGRDAGTVAAAAGRFGIVRATNYGVTFDVVTVPDPDHLAYADVPLAPHTDNPYRDPVPGIQLLHCREASTDGGDSVLVDGLALADDIRAEDPAAFAALRDTPVPFRYRDAGCDLRDHKPVISVDLRGRVAAVHVNDRSMQPLRGPVEQVEAWYRAFRLLEVRLREPARAVRFRLQPGDILCFDNQRLLHGRTAFSGAGGRRHLEGCYADRDAFESAWRKLG